MAGKPVKPATTPKVNVTAFLKQAASKPAPKKSKGDKPQVDIPELADYVQQFIDAKKKSTDAAAEQAQAEEMILPVARDKWLEHCQENGCVVTTIQLVTPSGSVDVTTQNKYSKINCEEKDNLTEIFGEDTDRFFQEQTEITLTDAALRDAKIIEKLIQAVGPDNFQKYFKVVQYLEPTDVYHNARITDPAIAEKHTQAVDSGLVKPVKSSVKPV